MKKIFLILLFFTSATSFASGNENTWSCSASCSISFRGGFAKAPGVLKLIAKSAATAAEALTAIDNVCQRMKQSFISQGKEIRECGVVTTRTVNILGSHYVYQRDPGGYPIEQFYPNVALDCVKN